MRVVKGLVFVAALVCCSLALNVSAIMATPKTVLILSESGVPANNISQILFKTVAKRISNQLELAGFTAEQTEELSERSDPELLAELKAARQTGGLQKAVDYVALIQITADTVLEEKGAIIRVEIQGRMLDVQSGNRLALFELPVPQQLLAPQNCNRNCILRLLNDNIESLADGLGLILGQRLNAVDE